MQPNENVFQQFLEALQILTETPQGQSEGSSERSSESHKSKPRMLSLPELLSERQEPPSENLLELISLFMQYRIGFVQLLQRFERFAYAYEQLKQKLEMLYESPEESELTTVTAYYIDYIVNTELTNFKRVVDGVLEKTDFSWAPKIDALDLPAHVAERVHRTARSYIQEAILRAIPSQRPFR